MKKIIYVILFAILLVGCGEKENNLESSNININEWMMGDNINENYITTILGRPDYIEYANEDHANRDILQWDNYEITNNISGTLTLGIFHDDDELYANWGWRCQCNETLYNNIHSVLLANYTEFRHTEQPIKRDDNSLYCGFRLWKNEKDSIEFGIEYLYALYVYYYDDGVISLSWGQHNTYSDEARAMYEQSKI